MQVIAGGRDWTVPPTNGYFLTDRLPHCRLDILNAGHFTWEYAPNDYAGLVINWWQQADPACQ